MPESPRKADQVAGDLIGRIVRGELAVGTILPREEDLAADYGVNRSVVREAGKLLEVHRLVEPRRRRGTEVLDPMESSSPEVLTALLVDAEGNLDPEFLAEFLEIRALLDAELAALAAERHTPEDLSALRNIVERLQGAAPGSEAAFVATDDFGLALARASKNRVFIMLSHWHRQIAARLAPVLHTTRQRAAATQGYRVLLAAIEGRDATTARQMVQQFHEWANQEILAHARRMKSCSK
ncbi:MAG: GntR family transcriptional regulator [Polyangiaceae bacterium]